MYGGVGVIVGEWKFCVIMSWSFFFSALPIATLFHHFSLFIISFAGAFPLFASQAIAHIYVLSRLIIGLINLYASGILKVRLFAVV